MRNELPDTIRYNESGVVNLDDADGPGTHWVSYKKCANSVQYYDSFGNLRPPQELMHYFNSNVDADGRPVHVRYNYERQQTVNTIVCGHLCLRFLCTPFS